MSRAALGRLDADDPGEQMAVTSPIDGVVLEVRDGSAHLSTIATGRRNGLAVQVLRGLDDGDRVIAQPPIEDFARALGRCLTPINMRRSIAKPIGSTIAGPNERRVTRSSERAQR